MLVVKRTPCSTQCPNYPHCEVVPMMDSCPAITNFTGVEVSRPHYDCPLPHQEYNLRILHVDSRTFAKKGAGAVHVWSHCLN